MYCVGSNPGKHGRIGESGGDFNSSIAKKSTELRCHGTDVQCPRTTGQTLTGNRQWEITLQHYQQILALINYRNLKLLTSNLIHNPNKKMYLI